MEDAAWVAKLGRLWIPVGKGSRVQKQLGLTECSQMLAAKADIVGTGTGLSGTAWATVVPVR